jgi:hypothetical protein
VRQQALRVRLAVVGSAPLGAAKDKGALHIGERPADWLALVSSLQRVQLTAESRSYPVQWQLEAWRPWTTPPGY